MKATEKGATEPDTAETGKKVVDRSPNFPIIALEEAVRRAKLVYDNDRRNSTSLSVLLTHLGYGAKKTGTSGRVVSALRQFGLLDFQGGSYRISEAAFQIFNKSNEAERLEVLRTCARQPAMFREILTQYKDGLPSDPTFRDFLIFQKEFNPGSVDNFIRVFKASMQFAKLVPGAYTPQTEAENVTVAVGDYVQWESQGALQFESPRKVWMVSPDGAFVMVEGSPTGIPMEQVTKTDPPPAAAGVPHAATMLAMKPPQGIAREVFSLGEGEAVLQWPTTLDADGIEDLEAWLALVVKKLKRLKKVQPLAENS
jgi:hypothetical protein